jgi:hypothetical protein
MSLTTAAERGIKAVDHGRSARNIAAGALVVTSAGSNEPARLDTCRVGNVPSSVRVITICRVVARRPVGRRRPFDSPPLDR